MQTKSESTSMPTAAVASSPFREFLEMRTCIRRRKNGRLEVAPLTEQYINTLCRMMRTLYQRCFQCDDFDMNVQRLSDDAEAILAWITRPDIKASTRAKNLGYIRAVMSHLDCTEEQKRPYTLAWIRNKNEERGLVTAPLHKGVTSA